MGSKGIKKQNEGWKKGNYNHETTETRFRLFKFP